MANNEGFNRRQRAAARPRALIAAKLRRAGKTWAEVGAALGVSRQRAQALVAAHKSG